jgi:7,8-dihydro-6-hydroxymethylpterin-pyrophosphokinase
MEEGIGLTLIERQSSTFRPFSHSVATEEEAIALPHPNVLNFASIIVPLSSTSNCNFMTSPQAGAPTRPVPTLLCVKTCEIN